MAPGARESTSPERLLRTLGGGHGGRGNHKVFVGMAAGVGKTYRALQEVRDLREEGVDAIVGLLETHGREDTARLAEGLPLVPRKVVEYKGVDLTEMDVEAILDRRPQVVMIDELAHTNVPGSAREKRHEDVAAVLAEGIDVISTMNVQHIESLNDLVRRQTGVRVRERVPDRVLLDADEVILVDVTPEVLQDRMRAGKIYGRDKIDQALEGFFRSENLVVLRELALRQVADAVEGVSAGYGIKQRVAVAITPTPNASRLIRRGAFLAQRLKGELFVVYVHDRDLDREAERLLDSHRFITDSLDGTFVRLEGRKAAGALIAFVTERGITQLVMGASLRSRWQELLRGSIIQRVLRATHGVDVYILGRSSDDAPDGAGRGKPE